MLLVCGSFSAADGFWACACQHSIEHLAAEVDFRLPCCQRPSSWPAADDGFVATDRGLGIVGLTPAQVVEASAIADERGSDRTAD